MKKLLSVLLCVVMTVVFMPAAAWADDAPAENGGITLDVTKAEQNLWFAMTAEESGMTFDDVWNQTNRTKDESLYLYYCEGGYVENEEGESVPAPAAPFEAESADNFYFCDLAGKVLDDAPFAITKEGNFWKVTCTENKYGTYDMYYADAEGKVYGYIRIELEFYGIDYVEDLAVYNEANENSLPAYMLDYERDIFEGEKLYLYEADFYESNEDTIAKPFEAKSADSFRIFDLKGNEVKDAPFTIAKEGNFWTIKATGKSFGTYKLYFVENEETYHGSVKLYARAGKGFDNSVQDLWFSKTAQESGMVKNDIHNGTTLRSAETMYLYHYARDWESEEEIAVVTPYEAKSADEFHFFDAEGKEVSNAPFKIEKEGNIWALKYDGTGYGNYTIYYVDEDGNMHGRLNITAVAPTKEFEQDLWFGYEAQASGMTSDDVWNGTTMEPGDAIYLYSCASHESGTPATPFAAESKDVFCFYDIAGNEVSEVPFDLDKEGDFWKITYHGGSNSAYDVYYKDGEGNLHGYIGLEFVSRDVEDLWISDEAETDGYTYDEVWSRTTLYEGEIYYLYNCTANGSESPATPFEATSKDEFHFYDMGGNEVKDAPFTLEKNNGFWEVKFTGGSYGTYDMYFIDKYGVRHGKVTFICENSGDSMEQDLWVYDKAQESGLTWDDIWNRISIRKGEKYYFYKCEGTYETPETAAKAYEVDSKDAFHFYDMSGKEVAGEHFTIEKEGSFWTITFSGEDAGVGTYRLYVIDAQGVKHGCVDLTALSSNYNPGSNVGGGETQTTNVIYKTAEMSKIADFDEVTDELLETGKLTMSKLLDVVDTDAETGKTTATAESFGGDSYALTYEIADGYYLEKVLVNTENGQVQPYWWAEEEHFYALYDENNNKIYTGRDFFDNAGTVSNDKNSYACVSLTVNGYDPETQSAMLPTEGDQQYIADGTAEIFAKSHHSECVAVVNTCFIMLDGVEVESIEFVTKKVPAAEGNSVGVYDVNGNEIEMDVNSEGQANEQQKKSLDNLYQGKKSISKVLNLETKDDLKDSAVVVIPVENASDYQVVWFKDDNTPIPVSTGYTEKNDGVFFSTGHFSTYALVKDADKQEGGSGSGSGDAGTGGSGDAGAGGGAGSGIFVPSVPSIPSVPPADDNTADDAEQLAAKIEAVKAAKLKVSSKLVKTKSGKKAVKLTWKCDSDVDFDGYEIYRSVKKNSGYGKKPIFTAKKASYLNTSVKAGNKYFYKVRGFIEVDGKKVYTSWSTKAWRTVK